MSIGDTNDMALTEAQAQALVASKAVNPVTSQPFTMEDLGFKKAPAVPPTDMSGLTAEVTKLQTENNHLKQLAGLLKKQFEARIIDGLKIRLDKLQAAGLSKEFIDKTLVPQLGVYNMSAMPDGSIAPHPLEVTLSALEVALPKNTPNHSNHFPVGADILQFDDGNSDLNDKDANEAIDELLKSI